MAFDASPSWSGFNYQGKVALYYALKQINMKPVGVDFSNYSLMLERNEDFEILRDDNPVSFHQVKAYSSGSYSKYSNALLEITLELYKQPGVTGKLHVWKPISFKTGTRNLIESIRDDLRIIVDEYEVQNPKNGSTVIEKSASTEAGISKQSSVLRAAFKDCAADELCMILKSILDGRSDALSRLDSYQYDDGNKFCDLNEINNKICSEIEKYLSARDEISTAEKIGKTFNCFLGMMDLYIIQRHKTKQDEEKIQIKFNEIIQSLEIDHEDVGKEYLAYKFKESFARLIDEYIGDPEDYEEPEDDQKCNLKEARKILLNLSPQQLWEHYRSFCPHVYLEHDNNTDNALYTDPDGIRYVLIKILHEINFERASHNFSSNKFLYRTTSLPCQIYLPTTITNTARVTQIERRITLNPSMSEILYEVENIIYSGLELYTFSPTSMTHTEAPRSEDEDPRSKRDEILKKITLVPISVAKNELT